MVVRNCWLDWCAHRFLIGICRADIPVHQHSWPQLALDLASWVECVEGRISTGDSLVRSLIEAGLCMESWTIALDRRYNSEEVLPSAWYCSRKGAGCLDSNVRALMSELSASDWPLCKVLCVGR